MTHTTEKLAEEIEATALKLLPGERARLAARLIASLDRDSDADAEVLWLREAEQRLESLESGDVAAIDAEQVVAKARSTLR